MTAILIKAEVIFKLPRENILKPTKWYISTPLGSLSTQGRERREAKATREGEGEGERRKGIIAQEWKH